jgi:hypothetical protein
LPITVGSLPRFLRSISSMVRLRQAVAVEYAREGKIGTDLNLTS